MLSILFVANHVMGDQNRCPLFGPLFMSVFKFVFLLDRSMIKHGPLLHVNELLVCCCCVLCVCGDRSFYGDGSKTVKGLRNKRLLISNSMYDGCEISRREQIIQAGKGCQHLYVQFQCHHCIVHVVVHGLNLASQLNLIT